MGRNRHNRGACRRISRSCTRMRVIVMPPCACARPARHDSFVCAIIITHAFTHARSPVTTKTHTNRLKLTHTSLCPFRCFCPHKRGLGASSGPQLAQTTFTRARAVSAGIINLNVYTATAKLWNSPAKAPVQVRGNVCSVARRASR